MRTGCSFSDTDGWALGTSGFAHWNGASWTQVAGPSGLGVVLAVADHGATDAWAVGRVSSGYRSFSPQLAHWNGTSWSLTPSPPIAARAGTLSGVTVLSAGDAWMVGYQNNFGSSITLTEHWDGTRWAIVPSPVRPHPELPQLDQRRLTGRGHGSLVNRRLGRPRLVHVHRRRPVRRLPRPADPLDRRRLDAGHRAPHRRLQGDPRHRHYPWRAPDLGHQTPAPWSLMARP